MGDAFFKRIIAQSLPRSWNAFTNPYVQGHVDETDKDPNKHVDSQRLIGLIKQEYEMIESQKKRDAKAQKQSEKNNSSLANRLSESSNNKKASTSNGSSNLRAKKHCKHCGRDNHYKSECRFKDMTKCSDCERFHKGDKCWEPPTGSKRPWKGKGKESEASSNKKKKEAHSTEDNEQANNAMIHGAFVSLFAATIAEADVDTGEDSDSDRDRHQNECVNVASTSVVGSLKYTNDDLYVWVADSASTVHVMNRCDAFVTYNPVPKIPVTGVGGVKAFAIAQGTVNLYSECDGMMHMLMLKNILHILNNMNNLLSVIRWEDVLGRNAHFKDHEVTLNENGITIARGNRRNSKLYKISFALAPASSSSSPEESEPIEDLICFSVRLSVPWEVWHKRFGHIAYSGLEKLLRLSLVDGLDVNMQTPKPDCVTCMEAKLSEAPYGPALVKSTKVGELTHTDIWGRYDKKSINGNHYFLLLIDNAS